MNVVKALGLLVFGFAVLALVGCGGGAGKASSTQPEMASAPQKVFEPECFKVPTEDENYIYGKGTAKTVDRQMSTDQADLIAATDIAANLERWVQERDFMREEDFQKFAMTRDSLQAGKMTERSYDNERKAIVSKIVKGTEEYCNEMYTEDGQYLCFRVLRMGVGKANKALYNEIMQNEQLMRIYKDTQALAKLKADVDAFEAKKAEGGM